MINRSIWCDTYYTTSSNTLSYIIELDGAIIYAGKAVKMPSAEDIKININKVCRNFLYSDISELLSTSAASIENINACRDFVLKDESGNTLEEYRFLFDYDYSHRWNGTDETLSTPINGHYADGQMKIKTVVSSSGVVTTYKTDGSLYPVLVECVDYVLYYLNARGGWDAFAIEGAVTKKDNITSYSTDMAFDNQTLDFEQNRYISEIKTSYVCNTKYLDDEQANNLANNLFGSNRVYLHSLKEGWIKPVVITDNSVQYQDYTTNGKKFSSYKINITESQSKVRS